LFVHRKVGDTDIYYVDNRRDRKQSLTANFRVTGRAAEIWHADTGKSEAASYTIANGSTSVQLQLDPYETAFVVFRKPSQQTSVQLPPTHDAVLAPVHGAWNVQFEAGRGAPTQAELPELASLSDNADKGIRYFSGHATYTKTIDAPAAWFHKEESLWLDLGDVANLAEVKVNGQPLGIVWKAPYRVDVSKALKPGKNTVEVRVANLWVNRLIGDAQPDATTKYTFTTHNPYKASSKLVPSGLIGPVQILRKEPGGAS
jgi:alpha-L-rhamnosidase